MLTYFTNHLDVTLQSTWCVASPDRTLYPSDFSIKFRMESYSTYTHYMALPSLQSLTVHHNKEMVLSTNHAVPQSTFSPVLMFSSTPDLTQSLPHISRSCNEDPIFHLAVHNQPTSQLQMLRSHHTPFAHPSNARNSSK